MSDIRIPYGQSRGRGFVSLILQGKGGYGFESRAFGFRFMDPITTGKYIYPKGYGNYFNRNGQAINPYTGRTLEPSDPMWHIRP